MGITEEAGKIGTVAVGAMQSQPLAIALLIVNCAFLGLTAYILGEVSGNAQNRDKTQMELISRMTETIRDCRQGKTNSLLRLYEAPLAIPIHGEPH